MSEQTQKIKRNWKWFWATLKDVGLDEPKSKELVGRDSFNEWLDQNPHKTQHHLLADILLAWCKVLLEDKPLVSYPEAPTSWNAKYLDEDGLDCQLTLRAADGEDLLPKIERTKAWMRKQGYTSKRGGNGGHDAAPAPDDAPPGEDAPPKCKYHKCEMRRSTKYNGWFCPRKLDDGTWCDQKVMDG